MVNVVPVAVTRSTVGDSLILLHWKNHNHICDVLKTILRSPCVRPSYDMRPPNETGYVSNKGHHLRVLESCHILGLYDEELNPIVLSLCQRQSVVVYGYHGIETLLLLIALVKVVGQPCPSYGCRQHHRKD